MVQGFEFDKPPGSLLQAGFSKLNANAVILKALP